MEENSRPGFRYFFAWRRAILALLISPVLASHLNLKFVA